MRIAGVDEGYSAGTPSRNLTLLPFIQPSIRKFHQGATP
jgi:hypothetical protein